MPNRHLLYEKPDTNQILVPNDANLERLILASNPHSDRALLSLSY